MKRLVKGPFVASNYWTPDFTKNHNYNKMDDEFLLEKRLNFWQRYESEKECIALVESLLNNNGNL